MPASAVARRIPAIAGMSGTVFGASGETEEDIAGRLGGVWICRWPGDARPLRCLDTLGVTEVTAISYFLAGGAILLSEGFASEGFASEGLAASAGFASLAASAGWSVRSILASARSLAT